MAWADEDVVTLAVQAARDCLQGEDRAPIDLLLFASTTAPYAEKQSAAIVAAALGLSPQVRTVDVAASLRGGTQALQLALDAVRAGSARRALVIASDCREGAPGSALEGNGGDAAVALLVGRGDALLEVTGAASHTQELLDVWRRPGDAFVHTWEERFVLTHGYQEPMFAAAKALAERCGAHAREADHLVLSAPDPRAHAALASRLAPGVPPADPLFGRVGACGTAHALLQLALLAEFATPGARAVLLNHGDGADALALRFQRQAPPRVSASLAAGIPVPHMKLFRQARGQVTEEWAEHDFQGNSATVHFREREENLSLSGQRCACGTPQFPRGRICAACGQPDRFVPECFAERSATLLSVTLDHFFPTPEPPTAVGVVQIDDGPRLYLQITELDTATLSMNDTGDAALQPGLRLRLVFRRIHTVGGRPNYFWKAVPAEAGP